MTYKERITELSKLAYSKETITRIIREEYGINLHVKVKIKQEETFEIDEEVLEATLEKKVEIIVENRQDFIQNIDNFFISKIKDEIKKEDSQAMSEILRILTNQVGNISFSKRDLNAINNKTKEEIFKKRASLIIEFVDEVKTLIGFVKHQNSDFTVSRLDDYRNRNFLYTKSIDLKSFLNLDIVKYLTQVTLNSYVVKNHEGLAKIAVACTVFKSILKSMSYNDLFFENHKKIEEQPSKKSNDDIIDSFILNKLEEHIEISDSIEFRELKRILISQLSGKDFLNHNFDVKHADLKEDFVKERINFITEVIKELKSLIKFIFSQTSNFTFSELLAYRNNNKTLDARTLNCQNLLEYDLIDYVSIVQEDKGVNSYKTFNFQGLKDIDEKIPEAIYILNNTLLNDLILHLNEEQNNKLRNDNNSKIENTLTKNIQSKEDEVKTNDNSIVNIKLKSTLFDYVKFSIKNNIKELYGDVKLSQITFLDNILFPEVNDISSFDITIEEHAIKFLNLVESNLLFVKRLFEFLSRITKSIIEINSVLTNDEDDIVFTKDDVIILKRIFNEYIHIDIDYIKIIDQKKFDETKVEIKFLYEAYDKLFNELEYKEKNNHNIEKEELITKSLNIETENTLDLIGTANNNDIQLELIRIKKDLEENMSRIANLIELTKINLLNENRSEHKKSNDNYIASNKTEIDMTSHICDINENQIDKKILFNLLNEEKYRLGSPIVNQFVDNITKRIKDLK